MEQDQKKRPRRVFTSDFKAEAVRLSKSGDRNKSYDGIKYDAAQERAARIQEAEAPVPTLSSREEFQARGVREPTYEQLVAEYRQAKIHVGARTAFLAKSRWRIERDYQDMKQHLGLAKYEGRHWGGFHRHFAMVAVMHAFLILYKEDFFPTGEETMDTATI